MKHIEAGLAHLDMIFEFCNDLNKENTKMSFADIEDKSMILKWIESDHVRLYLALDSDGKLVSMLRADIGSQNKSHSAYIAAATKVDERNKGLAQELVKYSLRKLKEEGIKIVRTKIYSWNKPSISTIEKCGFTLSGRIVMHEYDEDLEDYIDDLIYHKIL